MIAEHKYKLFEWSRLIQEQKSSGMTVMEFRRHENVKVSVVPQYDR